MARERVQKLIARAGLASRRRAEDLVRAGRVTVNGVTISLGASADASQDRIAVDGRPLPLAAPATYLAVHKPRGFLSSARDERGRRSVVGLVGDAVPARLWPAGRLDVESEGLMLLTDDGEWANRVLHPRYGLQREYAVLVDRRPTAAEERQLLGGVELDDWMASLLEIRAAPPPREIDRPADERGNWLRVRIGEGRKREVRRLFAAVDIEVRRLVRTRLGPLTLGGLRAGEWKRIDPDVVARLADPPLPADGRHGALTIAIDGPSGAGKSTVGYALAERLGATFVDTGLMYRALTLAALERGVDVEDGPALGALAGAARIEVRRPLPHQTDRLESVLLDARDVTAEVRAPAVDRAVSAVSRHPEVRGAMLDVQRSAARGRDTVMVGRDIGTVVLPEATLKVYLTATALVRAARRAAEMGRPERAEAYLAEIEERDAADAGRTLAPLQIPDGALVLDTGQLGIDECVAAIVAVLRAAGAFPRGGRPRSGARLQPRRGFVDQTPRDRIAGSGPFFQNRNQRRLRGRILQPAHQLTSGFEPDLSSLLDERDLFGNPRRTTAGIQHGLHFDVLRHCPHHHAGYGDAPLGAGRNGICGFVLPQRERTAGIIDKFDQPRRKRLCRVIA